MAVLRCHLERCHAAGTRSRDVDAGASCKKCLHAAQVTPECGVVQSCHPKAINCLGISACCQQRLHTVQLAEVRSLVQRGQAAGIVFTLLRVLSRAIGRGSSQVQALGGSGRESAAVIRAMLKPSCWSAQRATGRRPATSQRRPAAAPRGRQQLWVAAAKGKGGGGKKGSGTSIIMHNLLLVESHFRKTKKPIFGPDAEIEISQVARELWEAPFAVLAHDIEEGEPNRFCYANKTALQLFECSWDELVGKESTQSAEDVAEVQDDRQAALERTLKSGYLDNYSGWRRSLKGTRFLVSNATLFNVEAPTGQVVGQAVKIREWEFEDGTKGGEGVVPGAAAAGGAPPSAESLAAAEAAVAEQGALVRSLKEEQGLANSSEEVVLSLLFNVLLLGGSVFLWSGGGLVLSSSQQYLSSGGGRGGAGFDICERAVLNVSKLEKWGCKVFDKACFDQGHMLLHDGRKTPDSPNFTHDRLFETRSMPAYVLPGYEEPLGTPHYSPKSWDIEIRGPTPLDPHDVWQPSEFTNCTVPLVWWLTYFSIFGDLFIGSSLGLDMMMHDRAFDRNVTLAPVTLGLDLPPWYQSLLGPYTQHRLQSLSALSSREHIRTGQPRCYERAVLCNVMGLYTSTTWTQLRPKTTGRRTVEFYRQQHPDRFLPHEKLAQKENGTVFRVGFMPRQKLRSIVNLGEALQECKKWVPPSDTQFKSVDCVVLPDGTPDNFVDLLAQVQNVHALVNTHGSGNNYVFFMPPGSALVEILPWNFHGYGCTWADQYFSDWFDVDKSVDSVYLRLVADKNHTFVGPYEKELRGSSVAYARDQDVALDFPTLAKALERVARRQLDGSHEERTFFMTRRDLCPGSAEYKREEAERLRKEEEAAAAAAVAAAAKDVPGNEAASGEAAAAAADVERVAATNSSSGSR
ncbi:hypothetical protein ACK3TF_005327 [Chlorella vulgaris]